MNFKTIIALAPLMVATSSVLAIPYFDKPYAGIEMIQTNQNFKYKFGKGVFKKYPQNYSAFVGFNFNKNFGLEAGHQFQPNRNKSVKLVRGDYVPSNDGTALTEPGELNVGTSKYKSNNPYLGLFASHTYNFNNFFKTFGVKAFVGAVVSNVKAEYRLQLFEVGVSQGTFFRSYSKTKVVPMAKLIATAGFKNNFALRASLQYINMSAFKISAKQLTTAGTRPLIKMTDSYGIGIGLVYNFN